jgi:hypothetical protein
MLLGPGAACAVPATATTEAAARAPTAKIRNERCRLVRCMGVITSVCSFMRMSSVAA